MKKDNYSKKKSVNRKTLTINKPTTELRKYITMAGKIFNIAEIDGKIRVFL
ncbi:MAG: hypothetical protein PHQ59_00385 [Candidatus Daviesbacteria bacterium]|nr:hypothetical protein [Candidatus Daviesbacteria bacterium]